MRQSGVQSQPADPRIIALAEQGVSVATVAAACEAAKASKPDESIGAGYIVKIIERWAREAANLQTNGARPPQSSGGIHAERKRTLDALTGRSDDSRAGEIIDVAARQVG